MKHQWRGFLIGMLTMLLVVAFVDGANAKVAQQEATLYYNNVKIELDGKAVVPKDEKGNVVEPFAVDGTNYLPIRAIANALGLQVEWVQETKTIKLTSTDTVSQASVPSTPVPSTIPAPAPASTATTQSAPSVTSKAPATTTSRTVYVTKSGKRYHYDSHCNGGTYSESTLEKAKSQGLTPCNKCVN